MSNVIKRQSVIERQERTLVQIRSAQEEPAIVPDTFYEERMAEGHAELERLHQSMLDEFQQRQQAVRTRTSTSARGSASARI
ncbi:hypothetical protein OVA29_07850 [Exiguobacterium sp. SL14]|nr:hypothetical protein [Exiguobacterium sp. SL14]MCY1690616.1 hypothetical protein [Exiguobacterium sp. SL14]